MVTAIMFEKHECAEDVDAILSVKGIDMVQFGSSGYSMSLGLTGQRGHPEVVRAERKTIEVALANGLHARAKLARLFRNFLRRLGRIQSPRLFARADGRR